ncbi:AMP-binding protein [Phyllobacterium myrsinacearum]|uniref:3-methylmercaptopropionyl-CoA ligase n=1 Tax=Phyllobacterium myrsinacearum TaxID=28101 RepID=A0A839EHT8_9HYPH|nr:AMP-binding protein [Phyllobacterium myrsinacearum]MBA8879853.1 fatty-acyl-CoA synthase [Phyllobacterium myrsinacearum]
MITESYVHGASNQPLIGETIGRHFDHIAGRFPDRPALVVRHQDIRLSYAELRQRVDTLAAGFIALGLKPGDRIGIWSPNNLEWVLTQFATAKAGLILVNINPAYRSHELEYAINKVGCAALILSPALKTSNYLDILREIAPELDTCAPGELKSGKLPTLRTVIRLGTDKTPGMLNFADVEQAATAQAIEQLHALAAVLQFDDPINIQFTSGTTGSPKGATLTHHNILNNGFFIGEAMRLTEIDRLCIPVPFYHCFGMVLGNLACLTHGSCIVIPSEAFDPLAVLQTVEAEKCTGLHGVPTMFIAILGHADFKSFDLSSLRTGIMAGSPCPIEVMRKVIQDMHQSEITIAYGMTETSPVSFQSSATDPLERRVSTVGRIHPHVEVKIIDTDGAIVAPGVTGELLTRGYSVMRGYWGDDANTAATIDAARWMHTGDLATIDAGGYCNIVGRIKDLVIRGGENIYPREIEEFLYTHPGIADVQVFGIPDSKYGECLCAWIKVRAESSLSEHEVLQFCKGKIAHYKVPGHIRFVEEYPMTVTGKVQKFIMRQAMIDELGLMEAKTA